MTYHEHSCGNKRIPAAGGSSHPANLSLTYPRSLLCRCTGSLYLTERSLTSAESPAITSLQVQLLQESLLRLIHTEFPGAMYPAALCALGDLYEVQVVLQLAPWLLTLTLRCLPACDSEVAQRGGSMTVKWSTPPDITSTSMIRVNAYLKDSRTLGNTSGAAFLCLDMLLLVMLPPA